MDKAARAAFKLAQAPLLIKSDWDDADGWTGEELAAWRYLDRLPDEAWPRARPGKQPTGVAIVGKQYGPMVAPWLEKGFEFWCLNDAPVRRYGQPPIDHYQRWFQLHPPRYLKVHYPTGIEDLHATWSKPRGIRLYMDQHYPEFPDSEPYPKEAVEALTTRGWYHCSSMDWMLALAILEGFERIWCCSMNLVTFPMRNGEPLSGRACMEYWAGVADGRGVDLRFVGPRGHHFMNLHMAVYQSDLQYGFEGEPALDLGKGLKPTAKGKGRWRDMR